MSGPGTPPPATPPVSRPLPALSTAQMREVDRIMIDELAILERMGVAIVQAPAPAALVVDAVLGYILEGDPRGRAAGGLRPARRARRRPLRRRHGPAPGLTRGPSAAARRPGEAQPGGASRRTPAKRSKSVSNDTIVQR